MAAALLGVVAPNRGLPAARLPRRAASASNAGPNAGSGVSSSSFEVTPAHIAKGEVAREWVADVFENVDYELALSSSDAIEASGEYVRREDEDEELRYGEFDMGFFVAVLEACEPLLAEVEGTMDPSGAPAPSWTWEADAVRSPCWRPRSGRGRGARDWSTCPCCTPSPSRRRLVSRS